ncbi:MAG: murein biosynthesis integral membrane protein MurJ [Candidatus Hinthialibacter antarcticus]|nr:murein biosynthesis integral membrane protein MurJ [Candidatus Hinthialibacter antarcticus]
MKQDSLLRSTSLFSIATFISRILGLVRDACISNFFPLSVQAAFWIGFRIPSTFRQLFAEGALSAAFIPLLTRVREREGEEKAREVSFAVFNLLSMVVTLVTLACIVLAPYFVPLFLDFPGQDPSKDAQAVQATRIMFPFLIFIAMSAWSMGVLNTYRVFFVPALASAFFNISVITGALIAWRYHGQVNTIAVLGGSVIIGGFLQYAVQMGPCWKLGYFPPRGISPFHPAVLQFLRNLAPSIFGLAIYQFNALITQTYFASKYGDVGISSITYAHRLIQFPLGLVGVALATASFPRIAQYLEQDRSEDAARTLTDVLKYLLLLMLPAAAGLIVMGQDIIGVIFNRIEFLSNGLLTPTYELLIFYCSGLFFYATFGVMVRTFQAHHDFRTPVITGSIGVAANIALCAYFSTFLGLWSMALASSLASMINVTLLLILIRRKMPTLRYTPLVFFGMKSLTASIGMAGVCWLFCQMFPPAEAKFLMYLVRTLIGCGLGVITFFGLGWLLFHDELLKLVRRKR